MARSRVKARKPRDALLRERAAVLITLARLTGLDSDDIREVSVHLADILKMTKKGFQDVRIGRRAVSETRLNFLRERLGSKAQHCEDELQVLRSRS